jgi:hypothetical protein
VIRRTLAATALAAAALLGAAPAALAAPAQTEKFETFVFDFNTCNGEFVSTQGTLHSVSKANPDGSFSSKFNYNGKGTGDLGNEYVLNFNNKATFGPGFESDQKFRANLVSKGAAPNQKTVIVFTVNPDGTFESDVDVECRG